MRVLLCQLFWSSGQKFLKRKSSPFFCPETFLPIEWVSKCVKVNDESGGRKNSSCTSILLLKEQTHFSLCPSSQTTPVCPLLLLSATVRRVVDSLWYFSPLYRLPFLFPALFSPIDYFTKEKNISTLFGNKESFSRWSRRGFLFTSSEKTKGREDHCCCWGVSYSHQFMPLFSRW